MQTELNTMFKTASKLVNTFKDTGATEPALVAAQVKKDLKAFEPHLPLLQVLCNKGMRDRHWNRVSGELLLCYACLSLVCLRVVSVAEIVGFDVRPNAYQSQMRTLTFVLDFGMDKFIEPLVEISEEATKQWAIEKALDQMKSEWVGVRFTLKKHKETGTYVLIGQ